MTTKLRVLGAVPGVNEFCWCIGCKNFSNLFENAAIVSQMSVLRDRYFLTQTKKC